MASERHGDAELHRAGLGAAQQPVDRAPADADRRDRDQDHLRQRHQRLGLAMAEAMVAVGGQGGDPHAERG